MYWLDPDGDGDMSDSWEAYCDMTRDGGGWTKIESALFPFLFTSSNWEQYGSASDDNYSNILELADFADGSTYTLRYEVGESRFGVISIVPIIQFGPKIITQLTTPQMVQGMFSWMEKNP